MKKILPIVLMLLAITACKDKKKNEPNDTNNTSKPTITVVSKNIPTVTENLCDASFNNVLKTTTGSTLQIQFQFKGTNDLSQYKIDVHNNFDCHSHGKTASSNLWNVLNIVDITGKDVSVTENLVIPTNASVGNYHLMIKLIDELGNEASPLEYNVIVLNPNDPIAPTINLTVPTTDSIGVARGANLNFSGTITDNLSLNGGKFEVSYTDSSNTSFDIEQVFFSPTQGNSYNLNFNYTIPTFSVKGPSLFYIKAFDEVNNVTIKQVKVTIY
jgi:hypothetical protein